MGKKDDKKKKGKGAEKTATKTEKKQKLKLTKELAAKGEDDIENMVKAIEDEEKKRQEVKETSVGPPSHRSNFSMTTHPNNPEIIFFGGEFYDGKKTLLNNDFLLYNIKRSEWTQMFSPAGPPARSSHQAVAVTQNGGELWIFGGEFVSLSESQFFHYKDLWCFHFSSKRWEKVTVSGGPSSRSGHRMVLSKKQLVVFGGFNDTGRDCKYFNDLFAFHLEERTWKKLETVGTGPTPRSACQMLTLADGRIVVYGGYSKEKLKKDVEKGVTHADMFLLSPDKHDETGTKWRWQLIKQTGMKPSLRTGLASAAGRDSFFMFGGVNDKEKKEEEVEDDSDDEEDDVDFFDELYNVTVEGEKAVWHLVQLTGKKDPGEKKKRRKVKEDGEEVEMDDEEENVEKIESLALDDDKSGPSTVIVESGAFTISSTVGGEEEKSKSNGATVSQDKDIFTPSPRFGAGLVLKGSTLFMFGGKWEDGEKDLTLKDFHFLDTHKMDTWQTIIESDVQMEWYGSSDEDDDEDDDDEDDDDEEGEMDES